MALAALTVRKCTGTNAATETVVSDNHVAFLNADLSSIDTASYPVGIPSTYAQSPEYSMETWIRFELTSLPDSYIQNLKVYGAATQPDTPTNLIAVMLGATATGATPSATGVIEYGGMTVGSGLNDFQCAGEYTGTSYDDYDVVIDGTGTPNTFKWQKGTGGYTTGVSITGDWQTIGTEGLKIKFAATTGHTNGNAWVITVNNKTAKKYQHSNYYTNGTALALTVEPGDSKLNAVGEKSWYVVFQLQVLYGASQKLGTMAFNLAYEEV